MNTDNNTTDKMTPDEWELANSILTVTTHYGESIEDARWAVVRYVRSIQRHALTDAAIPIREAVDVWEASGDDEKLVNDVLDPWLIRVLGR